MKVEPLPGSLTSWISPPSRAASSREIERPSPVPPYLRRSPESACWKASKMMRCLSAGMPMPVSVTLIARLAAGSSPLRARRASGSGRPIRTVTPPASVNFSALPMRFLSTCPTRCASDTISAGASGARSMTSLSPCALAMCANCESRLRSRSASSTASRRSSILPASIFDRSRISLIRLSRSLPLS